MNVMNMMEKDGVLAKYKCDYCHDRGFDCVVFPPEKSEDKGNNCARCRLNHGKCEFPDIAPTPPPSPPRGPTREEYNQLVKAVEDTRKTFTEVTASLESKMNALLQDVASLRASSVPPAPSESELVPPVHSDVESVPPVPSGGELVGQYDAQYDPPRPAFSPLEPATPLAEDPADTKMVEETLDQFTDPNATCKSFD